MHCTEPCDLGEALAAADCTTVKSIHERGKLTPASPLLKQCPIGVTSRQAVFITVVHSRQNSIISYAEIAELFNILWGIKPTKVAVREYADKLKKRDFFEYCELAREGFLQGMRIIFSPKCCPFLRLPSAAPHTPARAIPQAPAHATPSAAPQALHLSSANAVALSTPQAPLLQEKKKEAEEKGIFLSLKEDCAEEQLTENFFAAIEKDYADKWPFVQKAGFDFFTFVNAAQKTRNKPMFLKSWGLSMDYAEFDLKHNVPLREPDGTPIKNPRGWIFACFCQSGFYPRPLNYRTQAELAQEVAFKAAQEENKRLCDATFREWRKSQTDEDILKLFGNCSLKLPPEYIILQRFEKKVWPEIKKQKVEGEVFSSG